MRIHPSLFHLPATELAPLLIGKLLCRRTNKEILRYRIIETECYYGESDTACHAHCGKTPRNAPMYLPGGYSYVYLCYGIHNLLNIVSGPADHPEAVLIRGVEGYSGPGRLTKAMEIDRSLNSIDLCTSDSLWIEDDGIKLSYYTDRRVGISYASQADQDRLWRFIAKKATDE